MVECRARPKMKKVDLATEWAVRQNVHPRTYLYSEGRERSTSIQLLLWRSGKFEGMGGFRSWLILAFRSKESGKDDQGGG